MVLNSPPQHGPISHQPMAVPPTVILQSGQPVQTRAPQRALACQRAHIVLGIFQMVMGSIAIVVSVIGICISSRVTVSGTGIYTGVFFVVAGILGYRAGRTSSQCLLIACLVLCIMSTIVSLIGLVTSSVERNALTMYLKDSPERSPTLEGDMKYQLTKCSIIICVCSIQFLATIVHASFCCASCCNCCCPSQPPAIYSPAPTQTTQVVTYSVGAPPPQGQIIQPLLPSSPPPPPPAVPSSPPYNPGYPPSAPPYPPQQGPPPGYSVVPAPTHLYMPPTPQPYAPGAEAPPFPGPAAEPSAPPPYEENPLPPKS